MPDPREPFLDGVGRHDPKSPTKPFDPKAVTRASFEPKPKKPKQKGPLVSLNRHPDAHGPLSYRASNYKPMSRRTKKWIVWMRKIQLVLRVLGLNANIGVLILMILITGVDERMSWVLRIMSGLAVLHCTYGIYHLARPAGGRTPSSSAAYQLFAALSDLCVIPVYAFGSKIANDHSAEWSTLIADKTLVTTFTQVLYYLLMASGGLHAVCLCISLWLAIMFRKITLMPPDMNPLEEHLTARTRHKRAKSSVSTAYTDYSSDKRLSTASTARGPTVPFHHTRAGSSVTVGSRDSRLDLPSRHYQITPGTSPRHSVASTDVKHVSMAASHSSKRGVYVNIPVDEPGLANSYQTESPRSSRQQPIGGKFTETWHATDSLISRTQQRNRAMAAHERQRDSKTYEALSQPYTYDDSDLDDARDENMLTGSDCEDTTPGAYGRQHPNPLRQNPATPPRPRTPYHAFASNVLSETSLNKRVVSGSMDIADEKPAAASPSRNAGYRNSSIQPESAFYSKPYGELKPATPPIMVGSNRHVSSGNDYDASGTSGFGRRNVSGKVAEEGMAGRSYQRYSRYGD
ncbi:hypothetical protein jhhlp_003344 [Lomentospora prolificans]|uniref:Uncharacterized protein n=1 Tax=Lomentospora prolificans TaxID=41688 RepID=A0A2N3NGJ3_9PEZI|nr:hypothetical protein jhhlp_003344 [Lomentospora prolificans]